MGCRRVPAPPQTTRGMINSVMLRGLSAPHALSLGIEQGLALRPRFVALAYDLDLEAFVLIGDLLRHIAERHRLPDKMSKAARSDPADDIVFVPHRFIANDIDIPGLDGEGEEPELAARLLLLERSIAADEVVLLEGYETAEACFQRSIDRTIFARPGAP